MLVVRGCPVRNGLIDFFPPTIVNLQITQVDILKILFCFTITDRDVSMHSIIMLSTDDDAVHRNVSIRYCKIKIIPPVSLLQTHYQVVLISWAQHVQLVIEWSVSEFTANQLQFSFMPLEKCCSSRPQHSFAAATLLYLTSSSSCYSHCTSQ